MVPQISVIMPVYNSVKHLSESIDSVVAQTFTDWELLAINEKGSDDGSAEIILDYQKRDPRIRLVQNDERLGLAESLNKGFRMAQGKYLARLDADDLAHPQRFEKQFRFMEQHPEIGICGTYQHHFGRNIDWVHKPPTQPEDMKVALMFNCNLCHSTLMLRRDTIFSHELFYDNSYLAEDFELWTRAIQVTEIANIPEVLGEYRKDGANITASKMEGLKAESCKIVAQALRSCIGIDLTERQSRYFQGWSNKFHEARCQAEREQWLSEFEQVLRAIYEQNRKRKAVSEKSLLNRMAFEWRFAKYDIPRNWSGEVIVKSIDEIFRDKNKPSLITRYRAFRKNNPRFSIRLKKIIKKFILHPAAQTIRRIVKSIFRECLEEIDHSVERWTWDRYKKIQVGLGRESGALSTEPFAKIPYHMGEKIRLGILFQIPSAWASLESVWEVLRGDERFDAKIYLFDKELKEPAQMAGARKFLIEHQIPFISVDQFTFVEENLHVLIYQTPWDEDHRPRYLQSDVIAQLGTRIAYITYGLSYSASVWVGHQFSDTKFKAYAWKVFTYSERARFDHVCLSPRGGQNVVGVGHPKFDAIANKQNYPLEPGLTARIAGRKIVFIQMHFPAPDGNPSIPEADIHSYIDFLKQAEEYRQFFFLVRPHPKLFETSEQRGLSNVAEELQRVLNDGENVFHYSDPDYRPALFAADYVVGDRSALMIEAGALHVPVLYMTNFYYKEKMLPAIEPLFESYYQGSFAYDIRRFLDMVAIKGLDYKKEERERAARNCLPELDGQGGRRIVDDIAETIYREGDIYAGNIGSDASL